MKLNLPNIISLSRIIIAPVFVFLILRTSSLAQQSACLLFVFGAITDYIDGWYARKYHEMTDLGKFVDPLADKFLTTAAFISFVVLKIIPLWMVIIIVIRDFGTTFLRIFGEYTGKKMITSKSAKWKTALQMFFITYILVILFIKGSKSHIRPDYLNSYLYSEYIYLVMLVLTILTIWTIIEYFFQNREMLKILKERVIKKNYVKE